MKKPLTVQFILSTRGSIEPYQRHAKCSSQQAKSQQELRFTRYELRISGNQAMSASDYIRVKELLGLSNRLRAAQGRPALRSWWHLHRVMRVAGVPMRRAESRAIFYERRAAMEAVEEWENNHRREHPAQAHVRMSSTEYRERFYELPTVARLLGRSRVWVNDRVTGYELRAVWHPTLCRLVVLEKDLQKYELRITKDEFQGIKP